MKIIAKTGRDEIANVYIAETDSGKRIEFVESIQPPLTRDDKWVLILSSLFGCPVGCGFCDAGGYYQGKLSEEELLQQIDFLVTRRFPDRKINSKKFKIQFARMGEPALNNNVLSVLKKLPELYEVPGLLPSLSTVAPLGADAFFEELIEIKNSLYKDKFQMQFSIHTTDEKLRDKLIPIKKWNFAQITEYGERFFSEGDKKITLNFALAKDMPIDTKVLLKYFNPDKFIIKITPINPTFKAQENNFDSYVEPSKTEYELINRIKKAGYDVILSIGELEENNIGSNCGQYLASLEKNCEGLDNSYTYELEKV